ncbi:SpoIIIAH-like family protein [Bacillus pacificus]
MLKKQTVWLLTMLSLVVVLSVYYVTTPEKMNTASPTTGEKIGQEKQGTDKAVTNEAPKETPKKRIQARKHQIKKQTKKQIKKRVLQKKQVKKKLT